MSLFQLISAELKRGSVFLVSCVSPPRSFSHGPVCRHDSLRAAPQSEGVLPAAVRTAHL